MKKPQKVLVEIVTDQGLNSGKYVLEGNSVILEKEKKDRSSVEYKPTFTKESWIYYHVGKWFFKRLKRKLMIMKDADAFINFTGSQPDIASWDRKALTKASEAHVLKIAGATTQKIEIPMLFYLLIGAVLFLQAYGLYLLMQVFGIV